MKEKEFNKILNLTNQQTKLLDILHEKIEEIERLEKQIHNLKIKTEHSNPTYWRNKYCELKE